MSYPPPPPPGGEPPPGGQPPPPPGGGSYSTPPGGGGYPPPPGGGGYAQPQSSQKALWSLIVGIISLPLAFCCGPLGLVGIAAFVLGNGANRDIRASGGQQSGEGMAKAGVILGIIAIVLSVLTTAWLVYVISTGADYYYNFDTGTG